MKRSILVCCSVVLLPMALCQADPTDPTVVELQTVIHPDLTNLLDRANTLITLTGQQITALNGLAKDATMQQVADSVTEMNNTLKDFKNVIGQPANVTAGFDTLHGYVNNWKSDDKMDPNPKFDDINTPNGSGDGNKAFTIDGGGLFNDSKSKPGFPIGDSFMDPPLTNGDKPTKVDRNPALYVGPVNELASVSLYYKMRTKIIDRRTQLQNLLSDTLDQIKNAQDFATVEKETSLLIAIDGQIRACNEDLNMAFTDSAERGLQALAMSQIQQIASNEQVNQQMLDKQNSANSLKSSMTSATTTVTGPSTSSATPLSSITFQSGLLPWKGYTY